MANQNSQPQSIFPDVPRESPVVDKNGDFTALWSLGIGQLFQTLQENFKNEGVLLPVLNATSIATIQAIYTPLIGHPLPTGTPDISGQTIFDTTNRVPKQFIITYDAATPPNIIGALWLQINVMTFNAGIPDATVIGNVGWFCYDTTNKVLYICTTGATPGPTVWTAV